MENTENMTTVKAADVTPEEIQTVREHIWMIVDDHLVDRDSPLVAALLFILDTLEAGKDITIIAQPAPEEYVLAH